jgi:TolB-like protein
VKFNILIITLLLSTALHSQTNIAVVVFRSQGIGTQYASLLTDKLTHELLITKEYNVYEREMLSKIIEEQKLQLSGLTSDKDLARLGELANVEMIVSGSINRIENLYVISARMISVETGKVYSSAEFSYTGEKSTLLTVGMSAIAAQLVSPTARLEQEIDRIIRKRNMIIGAGTILTIAAGAMKYLSASVYADYEATKESAEAAKYYDQTKDFNNAAAISAGCALVTLIPILYYQNRINKLKEEIKRTNSDL